MGGHARSRVAPYPYELALTLNGVSEGFMLARHPRYHYPLFAESGTSNQDPPDEQTLSWDGFEGGIGLRERAADDQAGARTIFWSDCGADFGGVDGSYGPLILGPKINTTTVDSGKTVRWLCYFSGNGKWYAGVDAKIYESASGLFTDAVLSRSGLVNSLHAIEWQGSNSVPLLFVAQQNGSYLTYDGTTWSNSSTTSSYTGHLQFFGKTTTTGATFTDYTAAVGDSDAGTAADLSSLGTLTANYVVAGLDRPYTALDLTMGSTNSNDTVLRVDYYGPSGWTRLNGVTDTTSKAATGDGVVTVFSFTGWNWVNGDTVAIAGDANSPWTISGAPVDNGDGTYAVTLSGTLASDHAVTTTVTNSTRSNSSTIARGKKSLLQTGVISWNRPAATWTRTVLSNTSQVQSLYFIRLSWSSALDASTTITGITAEWFEEADAFAVAGGRLWRVFDRNRISSSQDGGYKATWVDYDPVGNYAGTVCGMFAVQDQVFVKRTTDFISVNPDGTGTSIMPELYNPRASGTDDQAIGSGIGFGYFAHDFSFYQHDAVTGQPDVIGPERILLNNEQTQVRFTALAWDRSHAMYLGAYDTNGVAWLWKWGGYRKVMNPQTGVEESQRVDSYHAISRLGTRKITSMNVWAIAGQPYLVLGDDGGVVLYLKLPKGASPLAANSGYEYTTVASYAYLPTWRGPNPEKQMVAHAFTVVGRGLGAGGSDPGVALATRDPSSSGAYTSVASTNTVARTPFSPIYIGFGMDVLVQLKSASSASTPVVQWLGVHWAYEPKPQTIYTATVRAGDAVVNLQGRRIHRTVKDWQALLAALQTAGYTTAVFPDGATYTVRLAATGETTLMKRQDRRDERLYHLTLVTAS